MSVTTTSPVAPTPDDTAPITRDQRRARTEAGILEAARELFATVGFERTTIRGVAAKAGVDPALVMHYYGNKESLFAASARWKLENRSIEEASAEGLADAALEDLFFTFEQGDKKEAAIALLRACLTHPTAAKVMRDDVMCERGDAIAAALSGEDTELRAALISACMMGLGMARYLLEFEPVTTATPEKISELMKPVLDALIKPVGVVGG